MHRKNNLPIIFIIVIIALAILWLSPDSAAFLTIKRILMIILAVIAVLLILLISKKREIQHNVRIVDIETASQMNPNQYLSKGGPVCAGSDGRYHVSFLLENGVTLILSLSSRQAEALAKGMRGTLVYHDAVFISFAPEK